MASKAKTKATKKPASSAGRKTRLEREQLAVLILNVGDGDAIVLRFPPAWSPGANGRPGRTIGAVVDCYDAKKTLHALDSLGIEETLVLTLVDGRRTVGEIVDRSDMSSFNAYKNLYRLLSLKLVRRVGTP